ncbi:hypothetical protein CJI58_003515 [Bifidobacteriaceae bacterium NR047]|nr:hypothetical protein [Bifidobacteriaceae bacterium NR047]
MRNGISDMHCMSDGYLVQDLLEEMHDASSSNDDSSSNVVKEF